MDEESALEELRGQPVDTLVNINEGHHWEVIEEECLTFEQSLANPVWQNSKFEGEDAYSRSDFCLVTAGHFLNWGIYQPTQQNLIDFSGVNGHTDTEVGRNGISQEWAEPGNESTGEVTISGAWIVDVEDFGLETVYVDIACNERSSEWGIGVGSGIMSVSVHNSDEVIYQDVCENSMLKLEPGKYDIAFSTLWTGVNSSYTVFAGVNVIAYQPLLIGENGQALTVTTPPISPELISVWISYHFQATWSKIQLTTRTQRVWMPN